MTVDLEKDAVPIRHSVCGEIMAYYLRKEPRNPDFFMSKDFLRLDGTQPAPGEPFNEKCPKCGNKVMGSDMIRMF